jgi:hypothetical protein
VNCVVVRFLRNPFEKDTCRHRRCPFTNLQLATSLNTSAEVRLPEENSATNHVVRLNRPEDRGTFDCHSAIAAAPLNRWAVFDDANAGPAIAPVTKPAATSVTITLRMLWTSFPQPGSPCSALHRADAVCARPLDAASQALVARFPRKNQISIPRAGRPFLVGIPATKPAVSRGT